MKAYQPMTHAEVIRLVVQQHGATTGGFHKTFWGHCERLAGDYLEEAELDHRWLKEVMPLVPDAYRIDPILGKMVLYEVEITSRLTPRKMEILSSFFVHAFLLGWIPTLIRVDEYGRMRKERMEPFIAGGVRAAERRASESNANA